MTTFTDGKRTVEITMCEWNEDNWSPSLEADILCNDSTIAYDRNTGAWVVDDIDYLKSLVRDWRACRNGFADDMVDADDRMIVIDDVVTL